MPAVWLVLRKHHAPDHTGRGRRFAWAQGECVSVRDDPLKVGRLEAADFFYLKLEDVDGADPFVQQFRELGVPDPIQNNRTRFSRRRLWVDYSALPARHRNQLRADGLGVVRIADRAGFLAAVQNRVAERTDDTERNP